MFVHVFIHNKKKDNVGRCKHGEKWFAGGGNNMKMLRTEMYFVYFYSHLGNLKTPTKPFIQFRDVTSTYQVFSTTNNTNDQIENNM